MSIHHPPGTRSRNLVISGTNFWNPGDDFVRDGVIRILRNVFPGEVLNFLFYNFNADFFPQSKFAGLANYAAQGDLEKYRDAVDNVVIAGLSAGDEIKDLYRWIVANRLEDKVWLLGAGYENGYAEQHVSQEPEATIFRQARIVTGRTAKTPAFIQAAGIPYHHINCPAILSVPAVKAIAPGRTIQRIGFSIQLPPGEGLVNQTCARSQYELSVTVLRELARECAVEVIAHHKTEYFHFLKLLRGENIPVIFSSFYQDLHEIYPRYDLVITTRLHASLFANGHGIPGIIINDTDRHTHTLDGFLHSTWVNRREKFDQALARWRQADLAAVARESEAFKAGLLAQYVAALRPVVDAEIQAASAPAMPTAAPGATPATAETPAPNPPAEPLPVHFFTIVLNGQPFIRHHIAQLRQLPFRWHWHIVEGVAELNHDTAWSRATGGSIPAALHRAGLSLDGTTEYLDALKREFPDNITIYRPPAGKFWDGKRAMVNAPLASIAEPCLLWQVDADELWTYSQLVRTRLLFLLHPDRHAALFYCHYFVGAKLVVTTRDTYGNYSSEWLRVWRYQPGDTWVAHEPPRLHRGRLDVSQLNPFRQAETGAMGLVFQHYAYATEAQIRFKEAYYGYAGAVAQWRQLQQAEQFPQRLADHFAWVKDEALVNPVGTLGISPLAPAEWLGAPAPRPDPAGPASPLAGAQRILFVRTDAVGDAVLASALLEPLRRHCPGARLAVLCQHYVAELFTACPLVDSIICYDAQKMHLAPDRAEILAEIAAFQPDVILNSVRSRDRLSEELTLAFTAAKHIAIEGDKNNLAAPEWQAARNCYQQIIPTPGAPMMELDRHADFLRQLGVAGSDRAPLQPVVWTSVAEEVLADVLFAQGNLDPQRTLALFPFTQHPFKNYPSFAAALKDFAGWNILLFGGPETRERCEQLAGELPGNVINLAGRTSLRELTALIRRCRLLVGSDSCGVHIACAVGVPNVVVLGGGHFGRFLPYSPLTSAVVLPLDCYGCNWRCPHPSHLCITNIAPEVLAAAIAATLKGPSPKPRIFAQMDQPGSVGSGLPQVIARSFPAEAIDFIPVTPGGVGALEPGPGVAETNSAPPRPSPAELFKKYEALFPQVEGWLMWEAVQVLAFLNAAQVAEGIKGNLAEIGAYQGKLSLAMATFLDPAAESLLVIDIFDAQHLNTSRSGVGATMAAFIQNFLKLDPAPDYVRVFRKRSDALKPAELGQNIRFFSVDGGHSCEETCHDLELAAQTLHPCGMIVLDDYFNTNWPGVEAGVSAYFQAHTDLVPLLAFFNKFIFVRRESLAWFQRLLATHGGGAFWREHNWIATRRTLHGFDYQHLRANVPNAAAAVPNPAVPRSADRQLPKISLVIPSFNQGQYIEDTITSILDQGYPNVEIIVCDGGSTDATVEVLKQYDQQLTFWVSEKDHGQTDAINKGLHRATGQILAYLNSDDFLLPNALHYIAQAWQAHPQAGLYTGNGLIVDGKKLNPRQYMREVGYTYESLLRGSCYLLQPSTFINRPAWERAGDFDVSLRFAMDLDYWLRVGRDFAVVLLNEPLSAWRMHEDIKTANGGLIRWHELWQVYRKHTQDQITPGLVVELFSILKNPVISQQLGMDIRGLASQGFNALYAEMQKTMKLSDCVPVGQGTIFKPVPPAGPAPAFRAYPPIAAPASRLRVPTAEAVQAPKVSPPPASLKTGETAAPAVVQTETRRRDACATKAPRVDIILQATGVHAWAVNGGWENAARQLGLHHRTFRPRAVWTEMEPAQDDGLFDYLANPQAEILLLAGFDWHSQPLHNHPRWQARWRQCPARKILYVQESVLNHEKLSGTKVMEQAFRRAAGLVDAIIYTDLADRALMESAGKPVLFQPFGVDDSIFAQSTPFAERLARAFFRGKHQPFAGQASSYGDRRALIQHLLDHKMLELVPYAAQPVTPQDLAADFNRYQVAVNFPSVFANHPTRIYEAMACGCAVVTNLTGLAEIDRQFESGRHLLYYSTREELLLAVQRLAADPALAAQIAAQGRQEVLAKHALRHRLAEAVAWLNSGPGVPPGSSQATHQSNGGAAITVSGATTVVPNVSVASTAHLSAQVETPGRDARTTIAIDGVIFNLQRGQPHGVSRVWHRLLEQLAQSPLASRIVLFDRDGTAPVIPGIRRRTVAGYDYYQRYDADSLWLQRWCDEEQATLLISTYFTWAETTPTVIMLHDMIPELTGQNLAHCEWRAKTRAIQKAMGYCAVSQSTVNDFRRLNPQLAARTIHLTPNAVGDELHPVEATERNAFRAKYGIRKPYFLLVGHRPHYKNALLFFRAFAQLPDRGQYEIVCAGGGPQLEEEFKPFVQGATCHVLRLSDEELCAAYAGALALAYVSRYEGFGLPVLEAQKCGCPVITCRNSSLPDVAGDAAIYVGDADEAALRQALLDVQRPEVRQTLIHAGTQNVQRFSWERTGQKLVEAMQAFSQEAAQLPASPGDPIDTLWRLMFVLDQGDDTARKLSVHLRTIGWQYEALECYQRDRLGVAEAAAAALWNQLDTRQLQRLAPLPELDSLTALVLGLAAELRRDWPKAWEAYSRGLMCPAPSLLRFRLAVRVARVAASGGDAAMSGSVKQQILPKLRSALAATVNADEEELAVLNWPPVVPAPRPAPQPGKTLLAPVVTAIVSTFKSERFLRGCLEDLEAQTLADRLEIIVVDSHSPQNERAIVEEFQQRYSNIVYIRTQERETVYGAWSRGARAARGRYLTNANTDDRHRADAFEILARTLDENPAVSLAYADCLITCHENENYDTGHPSGCYHWLDFNAKDLWTQGCFAGPQPIWRREVHAEHGYFDEAMISAGDYEFWLRLAQNRTFLHVHQTLGLYLKSPTSVEHANKDVGAREVNLARERYRDAIMFGKPPFRPRLPEPTVKVEIMTGASLVAPEPKPAPPSRTLPAVARIGRLDEARALFERKDYAAAWTATQTALALRPFHPEAWLLLARIALAAGAGKSAKHCAQRARDLAPGWAAAKQFLNQPLKGNAKLPWLQTAALSAPAKPRLTVCLIVKNEEQFLPQCLKSIRGLAAQVVVVDTGSTDRTVEIAREFGAEIHAFAWCDDFAAARNAALEHATGDWVLALDADEELPPDQHARLRADLQGRTVMACRLPLTNAGLEHEGCSYVPRLFRNMPGACYHGRVHEQVFGSLLANAEAWGLNTALGTAQLLHHGYAKDLVFSRDKIARNLKLLRAALAEDPADSNLLMNLGLELVRSGDLAGGIEQYREAFAFMSAQPPEKLVPELREVLLTQFTSQLYKVNDHAEVVRVLNSPLARHGGLTGSLHFALGLAHFELKQFREAADQMRQCLIKRKQPCLTPINTDINSAVPQHCIALSEARLGRSGAAEQAFQAALTETVNVEPVQLDYARFLRNENRPVDALQQLHKIVTANPRDLGAWCVGAEIALGQAEFLEFALDWTGEAFKALPDNPMVAVQRAEALLLGHQTAAAAPLWEKIWRSEPDARILAALILCEIATGQTPHAPGAAAEVATSKAFVQWYQKLIAFHTGPLLELVNGRLENLLPVLPTAAQMLQNALADAEPATPVVAG